MCARAVVYLLALGVRGPAGSKLAGPVLQDCGKVGDEVRAARLCAPIGSGDFVWQVVCEGSGNGVARAVVDVVAGLDDGATRSYELYLRCVW